ncbi:MAG: hypothetical protein ACK6BC_09285 [Cyanobacteriota bacterium]
MPVPSGCQNNTGSGGRFGGLIGAKDADGFSPGLGPAGVPPEGLGVAAGFSAAPGWVGVNGLEAAPGWAGAPGLTVVAGLAGAALPGVAGLAAGAGEASVAGASGPLALVGALVGEDRGVAGASASPWPITGCSHRPEPRPSTSAMALPRRFRLAILCLTD